MKKTFILVAVALSISLPAICQAQGTENIVGTNPVIGSPGGPIITLPGGPIIGGTISLPSPTPTFTPNPSPTPFASLQPPPGTRSATNDAKVNKLTSSVVMYKGLVYPKNSTAGQAIASNRASDMALVATLNTGGINRLVGINFSGHNLSGLILTGKNLSGVNFSNTAGIRGSMISSAAYLVGVKLTGLDMTGFSGQGKSLAYVDFTNTNITPAQLVGATSLNGARFTSLTAADLINAGVSPSIANGVVTNSGPDTPPHQSYSL